MKQKYNYLKKQTPYSNTYTQKSFINAMDKKQRENKMNLGLKKYYLHSKNPHTNDYYDAIFNGDTIMNYNRNNNIINDKNQHNTSSYSYNGNGIEFRTVNCKIDTLTDLIQLIEASPLKHKYTGEKIHYNINMDALHRIYEPIKSLNSMIGMTKLKSEIIEQILYFIQDLQTTEGDFMHTCIYGPPGTGKTEIAKLMGDIYSKLGILSQSKFIKVTRSDLIAGYIGQTAIKTRKVIEDALGGVLFIDEAYSLGNREKQDYFAKECIDTLCECLSYYKKDLMVIIAGYEKDLNECLFAYNKGLNSRFTWRFETEEYSPIQLRDIFIKLVNDIGWKCDHIILNISWFKEHSKYFIYYGRDMETLLAKTKIAHSKRVFCLDNREKKNIIMDDLTKGFNKFIQNKEVKDRLNNDISNDILTSIYS
jgi:SpoVK/Ycf46/Vps4 family AAA+-type ATPase